MLNDSTLSESLVQSIRQAIREGRVADLDPPADEIVDVIIHLSFEREEVISRRCFELLRKYEQRELEAVREQQRQTVLTAFSRKEYHSFHGREADAIQLVLEAAMSKDLELSRHARALLFELESASIKDALCEVALENKLAAQIAVDAGFAPSIPERLCVFYAVTEQWDKYDDLRNPDKELIKAYRQANESGRNHIAEAVLSRPPFLATEMIATLLSQLQEGEGQTTLTNVLKMIKSESAKNKFCELWLKTRNDTLAATIRELSWVASEPFHLRVWTCLLINYRAALDLSKSEVVTLLIEEALSNELGLSESAQRILESVIDQNIINQIISRWWQTGSKVLKQLIQKEGWVASNPFQHRVATLLLNKRYSELEKCPDEVVDITYELLRKTDVVDLSLEAREFLRIVSAQHYVDRMWQIWHRTKSATLENILIESKRTAEIPTFLKVYSLLRIAPSTLSSCNIEVIPILLSLIQHADESVANSARTALSNLESSEQIEEVCRFASLGNSVAQSIALENMYSPKESFERAKFLITLGQWDKYISHDPERVYFKLVYAEMGATGRADLLRRLNQDSKIDFVSTLIADESPKQLAQLTAEEWDLLLPTLRNNQRWEDLWACAQLSVPIVSAKLFRLLRVIGWEPKLPEEKNFFEETVAILRRCSEGEPQMYFSGSFQSLYDRSSCVFLNSEGNKLSAVLADGRLRVREIPSGDIINISSSGPEGSGWLAVCRGGTVGATISNNGLLILRKISDASVLSEINLRELAISKATFSLDGKSILLGSKSGAIYDVNIETKNVRSVGSAISGEVTHLSPSPNGEYVCIGTRAQRIIVMRLNDGAEQGSIYSNSRQSITSVAMTDRAVIIGDAAGDLSLWDIEFSSGTMIAKCVGTRKFSSSVPMCIALSDNGYFVAGTQDGKVLRGALKPELELQTIAALGPCVHDIASDAQGLVVAAAVNTSVRIVTESILRLSRIPLARIIQNDIEVLKVIQDSSNLANTERAWCEFITALYHWNHRLDST